MVESAKKEMESPQKLQAYTFNKQTCKNTHVKILLMRLEQVCQSNWDSEQDVPPQITYLF